LVELPPAPPRPAFWNIRPEARLLVHCAHTHLDGAQSAAIRALATEDIDWRWLFQQSWQHGILPLVYRTLKSVCMDEVPETVINELREHSFANAGRTVALSGELLRLLKLYEAQGIRVIPFKGPVLASVAYGNPALRMFTDLDILVHKEDVPRVCELLRAQGYSSPQDRLAPRQMAAYRYFFNQHEFKHARSFFSVEPHWEIAPIICASFNSLQLWQRAQPIPWKGYDILSLAPEDLLLVLCMHGGWHLFARLAWICDIAEFMRVHPAIDFLRIMLEARRVGAERAFLLGIYLAQDVLGAPLPQEILQRVRIEPTVLDLAGQVESRLFLKPDSCATVSRKALFYLRIRERWQDRALYILRALTTPLATHFEKLPLRASAFFRYFLLPLWRVVKNVPDLLKTIAGWERR